jgi:hypothetical protein
LRRLDTGDIVYFATSTAAGCPSERAAAHESWSFEWMLKANLARGHYSIEVIFFDVDSEATILRMDPAAAISVLEDQTGAGVAYLDASCRTTRHVEVASA